MASRIPANMFTANDEKALINKIMDAYSMFTEEVNGILTGEPFSEEFEVRVNTLLQSTDKAILLFNPDQESNDDDDDEDETEDGDEPK